MGSAKQAVVSQLCTGPVVRRFGRQLVCSSQLAEQLAGTACARQAAGFEGAGFCTHVCEFSRASTVAAVCKHLVELFPNMAGGAALKTWAAPLRHLSLAKEKR